MKSNQYGVGDLQSAHLQFAACKDEKIDSEPISGPCLWIIQKTQTSGGEVTGGEDLLELWLMAEQLLRIPGLALIKARDIKASLEPFTPFSIEQTWQVWVQLHPLMFNLGQRQQRMNVTSLHRENAPSGRARPAYCGCCGS